VFITLQKHSAVQCEFGRLLPHDIPLSRRHHWCMSHSFSSLTCTWPCDIISY
jgi:hypothetical protein